MGDLRIDGGHYDFSCIRCGESICVNDNQDMEKVLIHNETCSGGVPVYLIGSVDE